MVLVTEKTDRENTDCLKGNSREVHLICAFSVGEDPYCAVDTWICLSRQIPLWRMWMVSILHQAGGNACLYLYPDD